MKTWALHYNTSVSINPAYIINSKEPDFFRATDTSYTNYQATRKSSQGYIFFLFSRPINWKATLQYCVTKLTIEAKLIVASLVGIELV